MMTTAMEMEAIIVPKKHAASAGAGSFYPQDCRASISSVVRRAYSTGSVRINLRYVRLGVVKRIH